MSKNVEELSTENLEWEAVPIEVKQRVLGVKCLGDPDEIDGEACKTCQLFHECLEASFDNFLKIRDMLASNGKAAFR